MHSFLTHNIGSCKEKLILSILLKCWVSVLKIVDSFTETKQRKKMNLDHWAMNSHGKSHALREKELLRKKIKYILFVF